MTQTLVRLRTGARVHETPDGNAYLVSITGMMPLSSDERAALSMLTEDCPPESVPDEVFAKLRDGNWLAYTLGELTVHPTGGRTAANLAALLADCHQVESPVLSRFAITRHESGRFVLESPRSGFTVWFTDPALLRLDDPVINGVLYACGLAVTGEEPSLWEPHELWFHSRTRLGRHQNPLGATTRSSPPPAHKESPPGLPLATGSGERTMSLAEAIESRTSVRSHDAEPLTAEQLGEFLFRVARSRGVTGEVDSRPYPSGGSLYELEIYPVVTSVTGLTPDLYRYDPSAHALIALEADPQLLRLLVLGASALSATSTPPQVLLVITARFDRVMWKYQSMGYALTLKNVGVLMSTMYLVATAMGLAPCALGGGDSDAFCAAAGLDYERESSVGEFILGSRPVVADG